MTMCTKRIPLAKVEPDPGQPRKKFDATKLAELAASIEQNGLEQAITVRPRGRGLYWIVLGERRYRAHKLLTDRGLKWFGTIDCIVKNYSEGAELRIAQLVENMQHDDMEPMDEARALAELRDQYALTPEQIAEKLGLAPFRVRWRLQLLTLAAPIAKMVEDGHLDRQQALELARVEDHAKQTKLVQLINRGSLVGWKAVRNAADALNGNTTTADLFGPTPSGQHLRRSHAARHGRTH
jgi:ParB family chromosome partitioning protein